MSKPTGESEQGLHRIIDMIRIAGILILFLHFYYYIYAAFSTWGLTSRMGNSLLGDIGRTGLFTHFHNSKLLALLFLSLSLFGARGKKEPALVPWVALRQIIAGLFLYFGSIVCLSLNFPVTHMALLYILLTSIGYILILKGGNYLSRVIINKMKPDLFNRLHESFPQEERLIANEYSVHIPARYELDGQSRDSIINIPNVFRGCLLAGNPGSMKSVGFVEPFIKQEIAKSFSMLVYDFKYDELSRIAYNQFLKYRHVYPGQAAFYSINFDDLGRSHRCNPLHPSLLPDLTDAQEAARSILLGLNMEWIAKQGDFWVESAVNFVTGIIWFLRKYQQGKYCTWAHVIELASVPYKKLFPILQTEVEIETIVSPFVDAFHHGNFETLGSQTASAIIGLSRLASPSLYYVLTGNDFTLDLNNPLAPKILCLGSNPQKTSVYGAVHSVYINTINRLANKKGGYPFGVILDECSSISITTLDKSLATGRSNKMAFFMVIQDISQLRLAYGKAYADVLFNICGNYFCGQATGDTAKEFSARFGRSLQNRESISINASDTSITQSLQLENLIPVSRITSLSSGEFVGMVADNPDQPIQLKAFCARVRVDFDALNKEKEAYKELPIVRQVTTETVMENFLQAKEEIQLLVQSELNRINNTPDISHLGIE